LDADNNDSVMLIPANCMESAMKSFLCRASKTAFSLYDQIISVLIFIHFFFCLVIPNSFRIITLPVFLLLGVMLFSHARLFHRRLMLVWLLGGFVTLFYLLVGLLRFNICTDAIMQIVFVYVISPFIWFLMLSFIFNKYNIQSTLRVGLLLSFFGALSVPLYLVYFMSYGGENLRWIVEEPNVNFTNNFSAATMNVFGPLAFVVGGFFSAPKIIHNVLIRYSIAFVLIVVVIISGRSALILSLFVGIFFFLFFNLFYPCIELKSIYHFLILLSLIFLIIYFLSVRIHFDVFCLFRTHLNKIFEAGGIERVAQADALMQGIYSNFFLGVGHGVGVDVIRSNRFPWRYELLLLATLYRVGLAGLIIYALPAFFVIKGYLKVSKGKMRTCEGACHKFILVGFITSIVISATNPYLESFDFQWMFFAPFVYFNQFARE